MKVWIPKVRENSHMDQEMLAFKERLSLTVLMRSGYNMLHIDRCPLSHNKIKVSFILSLVFLPCLLHFLSANSTAAKWFDGTLCDVSL